MIKFEHPEVWGWEHAIRGHKLDEWRQFCEWIFTLPNSHILREGIEE